jgi:hypothetical protein
MPSLKSTPVILVGFNDRASKAKSAVPVATSRMCFGFRAVSSLMAFFRQPLSMPKDRKMVQKIVAT